MEEYKILTLEERALNLGMPSHYYETFKTDFDFYGDLAQLRTACKEFLEATKNWPEDADIETIEYPQDYDYERPIAIRMSIPRNWSQEELEAKVQAAEKTAERKLIELAEYTRKQELKELERLKKKYENKND